MQSRQEQGCWGLRIKAYPFLVDLSDFSLRELGFRPSLSAIATDPTVRELAIELISSSAEGRPPRKAPRDSVESVFSFYLALALAKSLGGAALEALSTLYSGLARKSLEGESDDSIIEIARASGLRVEARGATLNWALTRGLRVKKRILPYRVHLKDYLESTAGTSDPRLKLVNQPLLGGYVYLDRQRLVELLGERFKRIIKARAASLEEEPPSDLLEEAREVYEKALRARSGVAWDPRALPPCITAAAKRLAKLEASGADVYLLSTLISSLSLTEGEVASLLGLDRSHWLVRGLSRLAREAAKLGYTVYTCSTIKRMGLCPDASSCRASNPVAEYLRRLKTPGDRGLTRPRERSGRL